MVEHPKGLGGYIVRVLDDTKDLVSLNWDGIFLVTGEEGDGKTTFVKTASYYLDHETNITRWAYNSEQFEKAVDRDDVKPGTNIIWDESDELSGHWADRVVMTMKRKFKRIRSRRLIIWLITPTFFDMGKYFAIKRTRGLFDVYAKPQRNEDGKLQANRGQVRFFNKDKKRLLYFEGKKLWNMESVMPNFIDRYAPPHESYPIPEADLEHLKDEASKSLLNSPERTTSLIPKYRQECILRFETWAMSHGLGRVSQKDSAFIFGRSPTVMKRDQAEIRKNITGDGLYARHSPPAGGTIQDRLQRAGSGQMTDEDDEYNE